MRSDFSLLLCQLLAKALNGLLMLSTVSVASALTDKPMDTQANLSLTETTSHRLHLTAKQMPLASVLDGIANKMHIAIHYSPPLETLVTADCEQQSLKQILECLLDNKADLIVRYQAKSSKAGNSETLSEAWVLNTNGHKINKPEVPTDSRGDIATTATVKSPANSNPKLDRTEELLTRAQSAKPSERAAAIGALIAGGRPGDPEVKATLERALADQDPDVRAQAISSLAHREGSDASAAIQQALLDSSDDVRVMAVEAIQDDIALLQQALNDSDESVRTLAEIKLELLAEENNKP